MNYFVSTLKQTFDQLQKNCKAKNCGHIYRMYHGVIYCTPLYTMVSGGDASQVQINAKLMAGSCISQSAPLSRAGSMAITLVTGLYPCWILKNTERINNTFSYQIPTGMPYVNYPATGMQTKTRITKQVYGSTCREESFIQYIWL